MTHEDSFGIEHFFDRNDILPFRLACEKPVVSVSA